MITSNNKLKIFENFIIDYRLPKHIGDSRNSLQLNTGGVLSWSDNKVLVSDSNGSFSFTSATSNEESNDKLTLREKFINLWKKPKIKQTYISVNQFFIDIKSSFRLLEINSNMLELYERSIQNAINSGQVALVEKLLNIKTRIISEMIILDKIGSIKYVDEIDVVNLFKKSNVNDKTLKLTWIKNYVRMIPLEIVELKNRYDSELIFDNYVVLHFDKNDDSTNMTKAEIEKAKDPILFGVINGSRKLYYIGDWIDEVCDLTLDKFMEVIGNKQPNELTTVSMTNEMTNNAHIVSEKKSRKSKKNE